MIVDVCGTFLASQEHQGKLPITQREILCFLKSGFFLFGIFALFFNIPFECTMFLSSFRIMMCEVNDRALTPGSVLVLLLVYKPGWTSLVDMEIPLFQYYAILK
jgi:hypothetical protein